MNELKEYLSSIPHGEISDTGQLEKFLAESWNDIAGDDGGMKGYKLHKRMEQVTWNPPNLTFVIERHGGIGVGSTRAELQHWTVNIDEMKAYAGNAGYRQIYKRQPPLNVKPIAEEIAALIIKRQQDDRLKWIGDGQIRVQISKIIPTDSSCKQTAKGRRKRLRTALGEKLLPYGYKEIRAGVYETQNDID